MHECISELSQARTKVVDERFQKKKKKGGVCQSEPSVSGDVMFFPFDSLRDGL